MALATKQKVGLEMLGEARDFEFNAAYGILIKVLGNILANPEEGKYRKLRTSNDKIKSLLATKGVRALLIGSGFVEESDSLNAETADVAAVQAGLEALQQLHAAREAAATAQKAAEMEQRNAQHKENRDNREAMKARIGDDATMRKEPGWKAQAAGCKESSKSITTAADIGCQGGGG
mmetsp:Transcript_14654/g.33693  ORF Transcript_14654/g.33693 Transcript_14654/m.33693 type:complete len:177 (-) Transcript_14654:312-842(-)